VTQQAAIEGVGLLAQAVSVLIAAAVCIWWAHRKTMVSGCRLRILVWTVFAVVALIAVLGTVIIGVRFGLPFKPPTLVTPVLLLALFSVLISGTHSSAPRD
jgi:hypothetical protein